MSGEAEIYEQNPIGLVAVVTSGAGYTVTVEYDSEEVSVVDDGFEDPPATVTVNVTSTTVPTGYHLAAEGDGSWSSSGPSNLSGTFSGPGAAPDVGYNFTIVLYYGTSRITAHDPRLILRRVTSLPV